MNPIEISCPAKTFVLGEYAVLDGGSSVLVNTSPRFTCSINSSSQIFNFPEKSPIYQWIHKHPEEFKNVSLNWFDPYGNQGGVGFSSAQFNIVYTYSLICRGKSLEDFDPKELWKAYRSLSHEGVTPSGADIISQWVGGVCIFEQDPLSFQTVTLPFMDLEFKIFRTGDSLKTHLHLKELKLSSVEDLKEISETGVEALENRDQNLFIKSINEYRKVLKSKGLVESKTLKLLEELDGIKEILALKGCGAMGADIVIIFYSKENLELIEKKTSHLICVAGTSELTYGIKFHQETKNKNLLS